MTILKDQVEQVANLARLKLTEEQKEHFTKQLNNILCFAEKLNELDTEQVKPTSHICTMSNVMREDKIIPSLSREKTLMNAPDQKDGMFRVPAVFEEGR
jgi:aspartyl-tRNA(Asn)/glutamyl-tRNA(Gln) amidotransferase subunit C